MRSAKDVAQIGAAIGREFSHELIAAVAALPPMDLDAALQRLITSGLISRRGAPPVATYAFKHALVQDAAYATLLKSRRRHLHASIAKVLVERFPAMAENQPEVVAHHYTEAGLAKLGDRLLDQGGSACAGAIGQPRGRHVLRAGAASSSRRQPETREALELAIDLRFHLRLRSCCSESSSSAPAISAKSKAWRRTLDDQRRLAQISAYMCLNLWNTGHAREAIAFGQNAQAIAESLGDVALKVMADLHLGTASMWVGEYRRAEELLLKVLRSPKVISAGDGVAPSRFRREGALLFDFGSRLAGKFEEGIARGEDGIRLAEALDHPNSVANAYLSLANLQITRGEFSRALRLLERVEAAIRAWNLTVYSEQAQRGGAMPTRSSGGPLRASHCWSRR